MNAQPQTATQVDEAAPVPATADERLAFLRALLSGEPLPVTRSLDCINYCVVVRMGDKVVTVHNSRPVLAMEAQHRVTCRRCREWAQRALALHSAAVDAPPAAPDPTPAPPSV